MEENEYLKNRDVIVHNVFMENSRLRALLLRCYGRLEESNVGDDLRKEINNAIARMGEYKMRETR